MRRLVQIYFLSQTDNYKGLQKKEKKKKIKVGNVSFLFFYSTCFTSIVYFLCWICLFITDDYDGNSFPRDCTFLTVLHGKFWWECFRFIGGLTTVRWNWFLHLPQPLPPFLLNQKIRTFRTFLLFILVVHHILVYIGVSLPKDTFFFLFSFLFTLHIYFYNYFLTFHIYFYFYFDHLRYFFKI